MKKTFVFTAMAVLTILTLLVAAGCSDKKNTEENIEYTMKLQLEGDTLTAEQSVSFTNVYEDGLTSAVFHLYPNAYAEDATHKAYVIAPERFGGIDIHGVTVQGSEGQYAISEDREYLTVTLPATKMNDVVTVGFTYAVTIPSGDMRLSHNGGDYALAGFYPQLSVYRDGKFRTDAYSRIGDPSFSAVAEYDVTLIADKSLVIGGSAKVVKTREEGNQQTVRMQPSEKLRDFAVFASPDYHVLQREEGTVTVSYFYFEDEKAEETMNTACEALRVFGSTFGVYPYDSFSVASAAFEADGMEYGGAVAIAKDTRDLKNTLLHEIAHQWWYGIVGSDPINESYMDEGLTTFSAAYYYQLTGDEQTFRDELVAAKRAYALYERLQKKRNTG